MARPVGLDPQAQELLAAASTLPPIESLDVESARQRSRGLYVSAVDASRCEIWTHPISSLVQVEVVVPSEARDQVVVIYLHGGGWVINDLDTHRALCVDLAARSHVTTVAVDYRRAPEARHPAALEDTCAAIDWVASGRAGVVPAAIYLAGDSAGATLAAAAAAARADLVAGLVLVYPVTDSPAAQWPSRAWYSSGYWLTMSAMRWYWRQYLPADWLPTDPDLFPLHAEDVTGLPPTLVVTAEFDPLRDEGVAYAKRLRAAGVDVDHLHASDQMHGFLPLVHRTHAARYWVGVIADWIARRSATFAQQQL